MENWSQPPAIILHNTGQINWAKDSWPYYCTFENTIENILLEYKKNFLGEIGSPLLCCSQNSNFEMCKCYIYKCEYLWPTTISYNLGSPFFIYPMIEHLIAQKNPIIITIMPTRTLPWHTHTKIKVNHMWLATQQQKNHMINFYK
jgi:hypothetical protein